MTDTRVSAEGDGAARERPPVRLVHLGLGRFFRAHQAWYTAHATDADRWGIAAFTVRSPDAAEELAAQGYSYPLVIRGPESDRVETIDSVVDAAPGTDVETLCGYIARHEVAAITLTVTEQGYALDAAGHPDLTQPQLEADLARCRAGSRDAQTVLGRLTLALQERRRCGGGPIAVIPCDNIPGNGSFLARGLTAFAELVDTEIARWIVANVSFVSTSVDRITPKTTGTDVVTEPFADWVLAGDFPAGRPAWDSAGARFVDDIEPWEQRKLWLLNGAHTLLAAAGLRRGLTAVAEAIADPACRTLVDALWADAASCLPEGTDHERYRAQLLERFGNARIEHRLEQIATDSTTKVHYRIAAVGERAVSAGRMPVGVARAIGEWVTWVLSGPASPDARSDELTAALASGHPVDALVRVVSRSLADNPDFMSHVTESVTQNLQTKTPPRKGSGNHDY